MAQVETTIDSVRRTIVLKQKGADILAAKLQGQLDKSILPDLFLANINATDSDIKCVTIHLENNTFYVKVLVFHHDEPYEVKCPIGIVLTLAYRAESPILVDEALFDKVGVTLPPDPVSTTPKQPWWRRLFKSHRPGAPNAAKQHNIVLCYWVLDGCR